MNDENSPFQNYASISVDDLKDQSNSLLNLVTEEQRPLRVFMDNGKEFLLFRRICLPQFPILTFG